MAVGTYFHNAMMNGWVGVDLFFVLSGYLISRPFLASSDRPLHLGKYALGRALRILPVYLFTIAAIIIGMYPFYTFWDQHLTWQLSVHLLFLQDYLGSSINPVMWSLGVEEKFYFLVPGLFLLWWKFKSVKLRLGLLLLPLLFSPLLRYASYLGHSSPADYESFFHLVRSPFHACFEPLFLGIIIAFLERQQWRVLSSVWAFSVGLVGLLVLLFSHEMLQTITVYDVVLQPILIALTMALLVYAVVFGHKNRVLENVITKFIAKISYSLYLVHWPLFQGVFMLSVALQASLALSKSASFFVFMFFYFVVSITVAFVQYKLVEEPFLRIKKKLVRQ